MGYLQGAITSECFSKTRNTQRRLLKHAPEVPPAPGRYITEDTLIGSSTKKWFIIFWYCLLQAFVTLTTTTYVSAEFLVQETYGGTTQVVALGQSMFIIGTAVGPAFLGPLSYVVHPIPSHDAAMLTLLSRDINGRKWVYVGAIFVYAILNIGCAKALNLPMLIIFQFLCGAAGSVALCNVAGTIADLFGDSDGAGQPSKQASAYEVNILLDASIADSKRYSGPIRRLRQLRPVYRLSSRGVDC